MKVRYVLRYQNPKTKKWAISERSKTLEGIGKKMALNLAFNKDWYTDEDGKHLKLRLTAEEKVKGSWRELEEYKITKGWKIKGYIKCWEKM